jgi:hypothetical protein
LGEVGGDSVQIDLWVMLAHRHNEHFQINFVLVNRRDRTAVAKQVGERQGKRASPRTKIGPTAARLGYSISQKRNVIGVVQKCATLLTASPRSG